MADAHLTELTKLMTVLVEEIRKLRLAAERMAPPAK